MERELHLPPLRDRTEDIPLLCNHFYEKYLDKNENRIEYIPSLEDFEILTSKDWLGNIRELENFIEEKVALFQNGKDHSQTEFRRLLGWDTDISAETDFTHQAYSKNPTWQDDNIHNTLNLYLTNNLNESKTAVALGIHNLTTNKRVNTAFILYSVEYGDDAVDRILENVPDDIHQNEEFVLKLNRIFRDRIDICIKYFSKSTMAKGRIPYYKDREDLLKKLSNRSN